MSSARMPAQPGSATRHLVDPELLVALDAMPSFSVNADALAEIRKAVSSAPVPAPAVQRAACGDRSWP